MQSLFSAPLTNIDLHVKTSWHASTSFDASSSDLSNIIVSPSAAQWGDIALHVQEDAKIIFNKIEIIKANPNTLKKLGF